MILKNREGQIRLMLYLLMLVVPFLLAAYLLRYVPIRIQTGILMDRGLSESVALSQARHMFLEDLIGVSIIGIFQGLLWYVLVGVIIRFIMRQPSALKSFGLSCNGRSLMLVALGFLFGTMMYFGYFAVESIFSQSPLALSPAKLAILPFILVSLDMLANGFGEETAFRAFWQGLLVDRFGLWFGIVLASASFVLLHLLIAPFTVIALLASILLACLYGILYVWTGSVFIIGTMHTMFNLAPRLLGHWPSDISLLIVNSFALVIAVSLYLGAIRVALD
jgi:membrane protease YdiL (CAAX protease family)